MMQQMRKIHIGHIIMCVMLAMVLSGGAALAAEPSSLRSGTGDAALTDTKESKPDAGEEKPKVVPNRSSIEAGAYYIQSKYINTHVVGYQKNDVQLVKTAGTLDQRWRMTVGDDGYAILKNAKTNKVIAVKGGSAQVGAMICQQKEKKQSSSKAKASNLNQKWIVKKVDEGYLIASALNKKLVLSVSGDEGSDSHPLTLAVRDNSAPEFFSFTPTKTGAAEKGERTIEDGVYLIASNSKAERVVSPSYPFKKSGTDVTISKFAASKKQAFTISYDDEGFYTVTNVFSGKQLAPISACGVSNQGVTQYAFKKNSDRGKWRIDENGNGYRLVNKATGLALDMQDKKPEIGTSLQVATISEKRSSQRLSLVRPCSLHPSNAAVSGTRYIALAIDKAWVIGSRDASRLNRAGAAVRSRNGLNLQRFYVENVGDGNYYIRNVVTKRLMTLARESDKSGVKVVWGWEYGGDAQKWRFVYNDDFTLAIESVYSGKHLHFSDGIQVNGKVKVMDPQTSLDAQKFKLLRTKKNTKEPVVLNVPCYNQNPQLPTGCESVALTNALRYWGFKIGKTTIADKFMPYGSDGVYNFIGNPRNASGWIICAPGIANTAQKFFNSRGATKMGCEVLKGKSMSELRDCLYRGEPLVIWTTISMGNPGYIQAWNRGYPLRMNNHAVVLCGYDPKSGDYLVADSISGTVWRNGWRFEKLYRDMGSQAVHIYRN